jgi:hypothetical protein
MPSVRGLAAVVLVATLALLAGGAPAIDDVREWAARAGGGSAICSFRARTGVDCLGCGGTRAFGHVARGRMASGFRANPLGAMVGLLIWGGALAAGLSFITSRWRYLGWLVTAAAILLPVTFVVHAVRWWSALPPGLSLR